MLIRIEVVAGEFMTDHTTDGMDEVSMVEIFKPVLIRVVGIGTKIELVCRRILPAFLVTSVLWNIQYTRKDKVRKNLHGNLPR